MIPRQPRRESQPVRETWRMGIERYTPSVRKVGRPHRYLLSGIAVCDVCDAPVRVGAQNVGSSRRSQPRTDPSRYGVYECRGGVTKSGFHVSMNQEHLDQIVTDAVLARIDQPQFETPAILKDEAHRSEHDALRLELKALRIRLDAAGEDAEQAPDVALAHLQTTEADLEIRALQRRIDELQMRDPLIAELRRAGQFANLTWKWLSIVQRRHIVESLVVPRIKPLDPTERGRRGINADRVDLVWR